MKAAIVCASVSHGNTRKVADIFGEVLNADVFEPEQVDPAALAGYDVVGLGSGIFNMAFQPRLRRFVASLPPGGGRKVFVFATSGLPEPPFRRYIRALSRQLESKDYQVVDTFSCRAFDTWLPFKPLGGINKGRPDASDLAAARAFAEQVRAGVDTAP